ncbi:hypothetical protein PP707_06970, partial [Acetobacter pasteurianus]|nr:hypothetical protein [Acetobacter pasteurianus]
MGRGTWDLNDLYSREKKQKVRIVLSLLCNCLFLVQIEAEWFPYQLSRILRGLYSQHDIETVYSLSKMKKRNHERNEGRLMMSVKITGLFEFKKKKEKQRR